jgi:sialate O-acetylesterase
MKKILLPAILLLWVQCILGNVRLPGIFGNNMVLQRDRPIPVWGQANAGEKITIRFNNQTKIVVAGKDGHWKTNLNVEMAGGPYSLIIRGKNSVTISNVMVGEVWICSGQSNMEMPIAGWGKINNYQQEIRQANYPAIRQIKIPNTIGFAPMDDIPEAAWKECNPETAGDFTAAGYFFARELYEKLKVPIGLINASWGGTMVETWCSRQALEQFEDFKAMMASMTFADLQSVNKKKNEEVLEKIEHLQGPLEKAPDTGNWKKPGFDDGRWAQMQLPGLWESRGLEDVDGVVWFRRTIELAPEDAGKAATLDLGKIDDSDDSYLNGERVGGMKNQWSERRQYAIPAGLLRAGKNTIVIRVEDTGGGGGVYGDSGQVKLIVGTREIALSGSWRFRIESISPGSTKIGPNSYPTLLYNAMINPLVPFGFRGVIWYQGETNAGRAYQYRTTFPLMINDWRNQWKQGDFPFYFVQLSSFNAGNGNSEHGSGWAELREAQLLTLSLPKTGMAVTTDIGNPTDIHPKNKQDVGKRLAAIALSNTYGQQIPWSGPMYQSMKKDGNKIALSFSQAGSGLIAKDRYGYLKGFEIAGEDRRFHYAKAYIEGDRVIVFQEEVDSPVAVRYGWADDASDGNLYNKEGFPASPFRTDHWPGITENVKYEIGK